MLKENNKNEKLNHLAHINVPDGGSDNLGMLTTIITFIKISHHSNNLSVHSRSK